MPSPITFQRLASGDVQLLRQLNRVFERAFDDPDQYGSNPPSDAYLQALLEREHVVALTALIAGEVVGGLVAYELDKFEKARRELYIYDLAVAEAHRRRGIATGLIQTLQKIAASRGCWVIYVQADDGDEPAVALYQSLGVREDVMHFDIPVG